MGRVEGVRGVGPVGPLPVERVEELVGRLLRLRPDGQELVGGVVDR